MGGTLRLIAWLQRVAPATGMAAGVPFFLFWQLSAWDHMLPGAVGVAVHVSTGLLLSVAVLGHQLAQGTHPRSWPGWAGAGSAITGVATSLPLLCLGLMALGLSVVTCRVHRPQSGVLLAGGAALLLVTYLGSPAFGSVLTMPLGWRFVMGAGSLLVAGALVDLGIGARDRARGQDPARGIPL